MKQVIISNRTDKNVKVQIQTDSTNKFSNGKSSEIELFLASSGESSKAIFLYGFGKFSKNELITFNNMVKQIMVEAKQENCIIKENELTTYLPKKRTGLLKNKIVLKIKNCPKKVNGNQLTSIKRKR